MKHILLLVPSVLLLAGIASPQWSAPAVVPNVNSTGSDTTPGPSRDGLTLYFASNTMTSVSWDIYRATRATPYGAFGPPVHVVELSATGTDGGPCPSIDDRELFFYSDRPGGGGGGLDIWRADRPSTSVPFNAPVPVPELNTTASEASPSLTIDGLRIYFGSTRPGGTGGYDIWTASRPSMSSPFGAPTPVSELNTAGIDYTPYISPDGLTIFFASDRPGGLGMQDIYMACRLDPAAPFGAPMNLTALNSPVADYGPSLALYADELIFTTSRASGGPGGFDLHSARFTGLVGLGLAGPGSTRSLRFSDPSSAGRPYVAVSSRGTSPGIPIDTRNLPLNFDLLFQLSIGGLPPVLTGYVDLLDVNGIASGQISFAGFPAFRGFRFFTGFVTIDAAAPSGIKTISNADEALVQ